MTAVEMEILTEEETLEMNVAAEFGVRYKAGDGISIAGGVISCDETIARKAEMELYIDAQLGVIENGAY